MNLIKDFIKQFETISLQEMDIVKLMDRNECKYTLSYDALSGLLFLLRKDYYALKIEGSNIMPYESIYYDLPNFELYTAHQNGKKNRYKVRTRKYCLTGETFLEMKFKNNKKKTIKKRIQLGTNINSHFEHQFLEALLPFSPENLEEKLQVNYDRIMLVDKSLNERVTIDLNLSYKTESREEHFGDFAIIEIKREGTMRDSKIAQILKDFRIKPLSLSKYCLGISQLYSDVKKNNMNMKIREIEKHIHLEPDLQVCV